MSRRIPRQFHQMSVNMVIKRNKIKDAQFYITIWYVESQ